MTITDTTATSAATTSTATSSASKSSSAVESSDFKSFLSLLTAQLKNQDPLAPLEATQFVEQLASFSSVEQQIETNSLLEELLSSSKSTGLDSATSWIGKEVEASASSVNYAGESLDFAIPSSTDGTATRVVVRNSSNDIVYSENIAAGQSSFSWDGEMSSGDAAPAGEYKLTAEYAKDGVSAGTKSLNAVSRVVEARLTDSGFQLVLENGATIDPDSVTAVRETSEDA